MNRNNYNTFDLLTMLLGALGVRVPRNGPTQSTDIKASIHQAALEKLQELKERGNSATVAKKKPINPLIPGDPGGSPMLLSHNMEAPELSNDEIEKLSIMMARRMGCVIEHDGVALSVDNEPGNEPDDETNYFIRQVEKYGR